jgi:hypothetical protein
MPLREFGGLSRVDLPLTVWGHVVLASDLLLVGNHSMALIDLAGEFAQIEFMLPETFRLPVLRLCLVYCGVVNQAGMWITIDWDVGRGSQQYNVHTGTVNRQITTVAGQIDGLFMEAFIAPPFETNDQIGIRVTYNLGPPASNVRIVGAYLRWA